MVLILLRGYSCGCVVTILPPLEASNMFSPDVLDVLSLGVLPALPPGNLAVLLQIMNAELSFPSRWTIASDLT